MTTTYLDLLGSRVLVSSNDPEMTRVVEELWRPFITDSGTAPLLTVELDRVESEWILRTDSEEFAYPNPWRAIDHLRHELLERCLARTDPLLILHGAVLERDGACLILAGPSGAGKTTLTLELIRRGWLYVSDDVAPFDPGTGEIIAFPKPINLKDVEEWQKLSARWSPPPWELEPAGGLPVPAAAVPATEQARLPPEYLLFCLFSPSSRTRLADLTVAQALALGGELVRRIDKQTLGHLRVLVEGVRRGRLTHKEKDRGVELLEAWLFRP